MNENATDSQAPPNWAYLLSCCAFSVPPGVALVQLYHDAVGMLFWGQAPYVTSFVVHPMVIIASLSAFLFMALRWREFHRLPKCRQWLVMSGCWTVIIEGFALCMLMT
jgi:hypothetical protein